MDDILYKEDKEELDSWIKKYFDEKYGKLSIFESLRNSCKRSRQNVTTLAKDLVWALLGKNKEKKK